MYDEFFNSFFIVSMYAYLLVLFLAADAALLGGCFGDYLYKMAKRMKGIVIMIAYMMKNYYMLYFVADWWRIRPAMEAPVPLDRKLKRTVTAIILGTYWLLEPF